MTPETLTFCTADGLRLKADVIGDSGAQALILLHGGGQTRGSWRETLQILAGRGYRVYAPDARGHGDSDRSPAGNYAIDDFASDVETIIDQVGGPAIIVGASLGGITGLFLAGQQGPDRVQRLVLVDVAARTNPYGAGRIKAFMRAHPEGFATVDEAAEAVAVFASDRPRPRSSTGLQRNLRLRDGRFYWHWDPRFLEAWEASHQEATDRLAAAARRVRIPLLLIHAAHSDVVGPAEIDHLRVLVPHLEYARVEHASHMVVGDRNGEFNGAIVDFLSRHPTRQSSLTRNSFP